jgi:Protein kinase domain
VSQEEPSGGLVGRRIGGYDLVELLGSGGMAEVYRGRDPRLGGEMAVKVLPARLARDPGYVTRFRTEAKRAAALIHPNIVPVFGFGEEQGLLYLVMPVLGESLRDRLDRQGHLESAEAVRLAVEVASALDAAHQQGLVHRDVKPENILLSADGRALLTDFGIAREVDVLRSGTGARTLAATGLPVGTPEYMAPEQLRGGSADQRVDVYALGAVLYEMLTGQVPHDADTPYEVAARVLTERVLPPTEHNPAISPALEEVVLGALAPDAADRYPDMRSLAAALRRAVLARPIGAATSGAARTLNTAGSIGQTSAGGSFAGPSGALAGLGGPTPLARSLATRRFADNTDTGSLVVPETTTWRPSARSRRGPKRTMLALAGVGVAAVLIASVSGALMLAHRLDLSLLGFGLPAKPTATSDGSNILPIATPSLGGTATVIATVTMTPTLTPTPRPTAVPPSLAINPTTVNPCPNQDAKFTVTYTGSSNTASMTVTSTDSHYIRVSINSGPSGGTANASISSGSPATVTVHARYTPPNPVPITINVTGFSQQSVTADSSSCVGGGGG